MKSILSPQDMQQFALEKKRQGQSIALVPTMGFLHEGHLSLIRHARELTDCLVVSVFVNPTQFGPSEDLNAYPRDIERDKLLCEQCGVDVFFSPSPGDIYSNSHSVFVEEMTLSMGLCGESRPEHFRGVATVVCKLFNIVLPDTAVFGQKDAQQAGIIRRVVRDLNFPVTIDVQPTVRECDGLALSSRNAYLSLEQRIQAVCLNEALTEAVTLHRSGVRDAAALLNAMSAIISSKPDAEIDYIAIVDNESLEPISEVESDTLIALAVRIGQTRLIDNVVIRSGS